MEIKTELTREEMRDVLARRIHDAYAMTIDQYLEAKACGKLPHDSQLTSIEIFSGEAAGQPEAKGKDRYRSNGAVASNHSKDAYMHRQGRVSVLRAVTGWLQRKSNRS